MAAARFLYISAFYFTTLALVGCGGGGSSAPPTSPATTTAPVTPTPQSTPSPTPSPSPSPSPVPNALLQFAVGSANIAGVRVGLNTVATFRQNDGHSAVLFDSPTITGPAGFLVNSLAAGIDNGTNHLSNSGNNSMVVSTFGTAGGVFGYGFAPSNAGSSGGGNYAEPFFSTLADAGTNSPVTMLPIGGPPLFPNSRDGSYPSNFYGYSAGFTAFDSVTLAVGNYGLLVAVPTSAIATTNFTANALLSSLTTLSTIAAPTFAYSGAYGLTITFTVPPGVTEDTAYVTDIRPTTTAYYSVRTTSAGVQNLVVPDNIGPSQSGNATPSILNGDRVIITVIGYDYPQFAAAYPGSLTNAPTIVGLNGQADITISAPTTISSFAHP